MKTLCRFPRQGASHSFNGLPALLLCLLLITVSVAQSQVNAYARITAISGATLHLSNANTTYHSFVAGGQVIIMQMQDNVIGSNTANTAGFGALSAISNAGLYEAATINSVGFTGGVPTSVVLSAPLKRLYTIGANSRVQLISFRSYGTNATISSTITPLAWDGNIGGVVAIQVSGTLTLSRSIRADGLGFRGGAVSANYESGCEPAVYASSSSNYAFKGEGIYLATDAGYANGRGRILTGGGGGSDDNGGGGGGGNFTLGGDGGPGWTCTVATASGGLGGIALNAYSTGARMYMGGGGGGGQQNNNVGTAGGNGGGIIIIRATTLATSCFGSVTLSANGDAPATSGNDGSGGGGAGGTILLQVNGYSVPSGCPLSIRSNGGDGGDVGDANTHGGGGGGGQGAIYSTASLLAANVSAGTAAGTGGLNSSSAGATSAGSGGGPANAGVTGATLTALPVSLTAFSARRQEHNVLLSWSTAGDDQRLLFNLQRSADGLAFSTIGSITSTGSVQHDYNFTDRNVVAGRWFYRVEMVEISGGKSYSATAGVLMGASADAMLVAYPNPAREQFFIEVNGNNGDTWSLVMTDLSGKPVHSQVYRSMGNLLSVTPGKTLAPGPYLVRVSDGKNAAQFAKVIIR